MYLFIQYKRPENRDSMLWVYEQAMKIANKLKSDRTYWQSCILNGIGEADELNTWSQSGSMRMVRKNDWKLTYDMQGAGQLYNLATDPEELKNVFGSDKYLKKQDELLRDLLTWELRTQDPLPYPRKQGKRQYGFKRDPYNYWTPYKDEPQKNLIKNIKL